jgi:hypothetical protein
MVFHNTEENDSFTNSLDGSSADNNGLNLVSLLQGNDNSGNSFGSTAQSAGRDCLNPDRIAALLPSLFLDDPSTRPQLQDSDGLYSREQAPRPPSDPELLQEWLRVQGKAEMERRRYPEMPLANTVLMMMRANSNEDKIASVLNSAFSASRGGDVLDAIAHALQPGETLRQLPDEGRASVYQLGNLTLRIHPARRGSHVEVTRSPAP